MAPKVLVLTGLTASQPAIHSPLSTGWPQGWFQSSHSVQALPASNSGMDPWYSPAGRAERCRPSKTVWRFNSAREGQLVGVGPLFWGDRSASEPGGGDDHAPSRMCIKLLSSSRAQERYPSVPQPCSQLWQGLWSCAREAPPTGGLLLSPPTPRTASALRGLSPLARPASSARQGGAGLSTCSCPSLPTPLSREPLPVALGTGRDVDAAGPGASASGLCMGLMPT